MMDKFIVGQMVHYSPEVGPKENGIVKRKHPHSDAYWVVYKCGGDWRHYENYTAALTCVEDLRDGWIED